jgi:hypothetical protein
VSIGGVLADARRRAGLSVTQVSHQTRIRETIIAGIEADDYSACGGDFYARGHIRSIAAAVGADPGPLVEQYDATRLGPRALTDEVTEPLTAVAMPQYHRPEPVTPAGMQRRRPSAATATPARRRPRRRRQPAWAAALGVALVAGLGFAGYLLAGTGHGPAPSAGAHWTAPHRAGQASLAAPATGTGSTQGAAAPAASTSAGAPPRSLTPARATSFGSSGGPGDNSGLARLAIDGNPATAWHTDWYATARFGNLYPGTGLLVDMGRPVTITAAAVILGRAHGASFQVRIGAAPAPAGLRLVARAAGVGRVVRLRLTRPGRGRYVLLWFTRLPPDPAGTFQASVYSLQLEGRT